MSFFSPLLSIYMGHAQHTSLGTFVGDRHSGIEWTLSKAANDSKLCSVILTLEGRDTTQKDLGGIEWWAHANLMKFKEAKCRALHMGWGNPSTSTGWAKNGLKTALGIRKTWEQEVCHELAMCICRSQSKLYLELHLKRHGQQAKEGDFAPLFQSCEMSPGILHPALGPPA